jgi:hypothetical protein
MCRAKKPQAGITLFAEAGYRTIMIAADMLLTFGSGVTLVPVGSVVHLLASVEPTKLLRLTLPSLVKLTFTLIAAAACISRQQAMAKEMTLTHQFTVAASWIKMQNTSAQGL